MTSPDHGPVSAPGSDDGAIGSSAPSRGVMGLADALRLDPRRWDVVDASSPWRGLATVAGGWALLAFGRFGLPAVTAPRPVVRFVLVGVYVWLAMAALVWLTARLADRTARTDDARRPAPGATALLQYTGLAHQPLVVLGFALQVGQLLPIRWPATAAAALALVIWLPALLVASLVSAFGRLDRWSLGAASLAWLLWAGTAGRYLLERIGHLF